MSHSLPWLLLARPPRPLIPPNDGATDPLVIQAGLVAASPLPTPLCWWERAQVPKTRVMVWTHRLGTQFL